VQGGKSEEREEIGGEEGRVREGCGGEWRGYICKFGKSHVT